MNFKALETKQKLRGGYYTPEDLADFLVRWAAGCAPTSILEPSCGDGAFLARIAARAGESSVTAFEVDPDEAQKARTRITGESDVCAADFLGWALSALQRQNAQFDAVVGNPPFIRYQYLPSDFQERAEGIFKALGCRFTRHTNAWVPFVLASFAMLREGGRLAMVVPAEIIHVAHAQSLRSYLVANAKKLVVVDPAELWFPGTLQGAVLLMAEKRATNDATAGVGIESVSGREFTKTHPQDLFNASSPVNQGDGCGKWTYALLNDPTRSLLEDLACRKGVSRFRELADVDVGIVTGANQFFHVPDSIVQRYGLEQWAHPMFGRSAHCPGVVYDRAQHEANADKGSPTNFVWFRDDSVRESPSGREYIEHGECDQELVSCPISFLHFRACCARQCKARSAGNIEHIGKGRDTAVARAASSRRARRTGPVAVLRPLARAGPFPAGRALPQTPCGTLKRKKLMGQDTSVDLYLCSPFAWC